MPKMIKQQTLEYELTRCMWPTHSAYFCVQVFVVVTLLLCAYMHMYAHMNIGAGAL